MSHAAVIGSSSHDILFRASHGGQGNVGNTHFHVEEDIADCDWLIVHDDLDRETPTTIPTSRRVLILSEPIEVKRYHQSYVSQFGIVGGPRVPRNFAGSTVLSHPAIPWFYGLDFARKKAVLSFDDLTNLTPPPKADAISVVISKKTRTREHRARLKLVEHLAKQLGDKLHIFGRDFKSIADKREAIDGYKYHLALENNVTPHFWTEKLADPWLGWSLPFFAGCPNLNDYFPDGSYVRISYDEPERSTAIIEEAMASGAYERALPAIAAARSIVLKEQSLLAVAARIIGACAPYACGPALAAPEVIYPNKKFRWRKTLSKSIRSVFTRTPHRRTNS